MNWVRSTLFNLLLPLWTALLGVLCLPLLLAPWWGAMWAIRQWGRGVAFLARWVLGIRTRLIGRENLRPGCVIYAAKHQSAWETMALVPLLGSPAIVLKQELMKLPFIGWYATRARMIPVDRDGSTRAMRVMLRAADVARAADRPVLIFPEGTRTPPGQQSPLLPGLTGLYRSLGVPVVPIALDSGLLWGRESFLKHPGTITVVVHPAVAAALPREHMAEQVHRAINSLSGDSA